MGTGVSDIVESQWAKIPRSVKTQKGCDLGKGAAGRDMWEMWLLRRQIREDF